MHSVKWRSGQIMDVSVKGIAVFIACILLVIHQAVFTTEAFSYGSSSSSSSSCWNGRQLHRNKRSTTCSRLNNPRAIFPFDCIPKLEDRIGSPSCQGSPSYCLKTSAMYSSTITDEIATTEDTQISSRAASVEINALNGKSAINGVNDGSPVNSQSNFLLVNGSSTKENNGQSAQTAVESEDDVPKPTANGGFTHTTSSRAKISAANKGKTPWNKGKARSEETRARIAEGVRRRNRERFLAKLEAEGITEEEHDARKKNERRKKDAERRARRTAKGGYKPTEETKQKISKVLKEKYAQGLVKRAPRDPSKVRRGFTHTEETKQRISESLKRKWAEDTEYRELMTNKINGPGAPPGTSVRKRIAETLKKKWEDPDFRASMMEKIANRKPPTRERNAAHRQRISEAMKKKWLDKDYRKRATEGMVKGRPVKAAKAKIVKKKLPTIEALQPSVKAARLKKAKMKGASTEATRKKKAYTKKKKVKKSSSEVVSVTAVKPMTKSSVSIATPRLEEVEEDDRYDDGCISRLREERRDLYDLLYGDDDDTAGRNAGGRRAANKGSGDSTLLSSGMMKGVSSNTLDVLMGDDDDLDDFDPYGLN